MNGCNLVSDSNIWISVKRKAYMNVILFLVENSPEGGYIARALGESIFTEAEDWGSLHCNIRDAICCHFDKALMPSSIRLYFVHEEVIDTWCEIL